MEMDNVLQTRRTDDAALASALLELITQVSTMLHDHCMGFLAEARDQNQQGATAAGQEAVQPQPNHRLRSSTGALSRSTGRLADLRTTAGKVADKVRTRLRRGSAPPVPNDAPAVHLQWVLAHRRSEFEAALPQTLRPLVTEWERLGHYLEARPARRPEMLREIQGWAPQLTTDKQVRDLHTYHLAQLYPYAVPLLKDATAE